MLALLLAGCAAIPPDDATVAERDLAGAGLAKSIRLAREGWPDAQWWTRYGDPQLDALIQRALKDSPDLATAQARIRQAQSTQAITEANGGANVTLDGTVDRQYISGTGLFPPPLGGAWYTEGKVGINASYDFDWWGKHRSQIAASLGEVNARRAEEKQAELTIATTVAQSYFALQADWARVATLQQARDAQARLTEGRAKRVARGLDPANARVRAEGDLAAIDAQIAAGQTAADREREALRALVAADAAALADLQPRPLPAVDPALPDQLGNELLARRPDLQAARWRVQSTLSAIDAQRAAFYPTISIGGFAGFDTITMADLFDRASRQFNLIPAISLPIFDSGRLSAQLGAKRADRDALIAEYNQAVVRAVREVAQEGVTLAGLSRQQVATQRQLQASRQVLDNSQAQLKQGLIDRTAVLSAALPVFTQQDSLIQLHHSQLNSELALIKALGGGYRAAEPDKQ
ncbi:efflux transporter outer membrane subunit [Chitiniphilus eburneus]|uniref:efflux transporter outer membrane subunit n=1 Tax=Chitiniphilus eburneus TaxID=2571148 RepID=UPI0035D03DDC